MLRDKLYNISVSFAVSDGARCYGSREKGEITTEYHEMK